MTLRPARNSCRAAVLLMSFSVFGATLALSGLSAPGIGRAAEGAIETFEPRPISGIVPPDLMSGPHFQLAPTVRTFGYMNDYVVSSEFGVFEPASDTMLRRTVREIHAIAALKEITLSDAYGKALKQAALGPVRGVKALVDEPVATVKAVPTAIFNVFSRVGEGVGTFARGQKTQYEDSAAAEALQMSSYKRQYAKQLGVDPYSSNPVLQKELDSVAWAAAVGGLTVSAATMASGSAVVTALSAARNIDQAISIVAALPPAELMIRNREALKKMGIDPGLAAKFLGQKQYSPRAKTILIASLAAMAGTTGKESMLQAALGAPDELTAIFYQQVAELLNGYDGTVDRVRRLERFNRLVLAHTASGKAVILAPLDYMIWNEQVAGAVNKSVEVLHLRPGNDRCELWITGAASPRFVKEANARGIQVKTGVAKQLPLAD